MVDISLHNSLNKSVFSLSCMSFRCPDRVDCFIDRSEWITLLNSALSRDSCSIAAAINKAGLDHLSRRSSQYILRKGAEAVIKYTLRCNGYLQASRRTGL